jgi:ribosomal protein S18 acetylase RimI-like enzyme
MPTIEHPKEEDIHDVLKFMSACDVAEFGEVDSSLEDLEEQWDGIDVAQDTWVLNEGGEICCYCCVSGSDQRYTLDLYAHQKFTPAGESDRLLQAAIERLKAIKAASHDDLPIQVTAYASSANETLNEVFSRNGFNVVTWHYRMQINFTAPLESVTWPQGFEVNPFCQEDETELYHLIEVAFDWPGHVMPSIEDWRKHLFRGGRFDPKYFTLLRKDGELVGASLGYKEETLGWVRQLAISKSLRGQGYGSMLLKHVFSEFSKAGLMRVGLGVESVNKNACEFYERVGMYRSREFTEYRSEI